MSRRPITMIHAVGEAMYQAMEADETVVVYGEDVVGGAGLGEPYEGAMGGTFGATRGLFHEFGPSRVRDTPISEAGLVGIAVGAAASGIRPVVDMMWSSFTPLAFDQIHNQAAKLRYMFGGQASVPLVLRMAIGAGLGAAGQHSDTLYSIYTHLPGIKVVVPTTPYDAKGLLLEAVADDDPVLFFEHMRLYNTRQEVPESPYTVPFGSASVTRAGTDVTIVGISYMAKLALEVAGALVSDGIEAEVIDPRTLSPLDSGTILQSVRKTGRLVVVDESPPRCSIATDITAMVSEHAFDALAAPVRRVTSPHSPVPLSPPLENAYIPDAERIKAAVNAVLNR